MRIIAGEHRGRRIEVPPGEGTRPMLDRVRESVFATLGNLVEDARVLDLFCGGGSLGLEALSRGALAARFVEKDAQAYATLKRNLAELGHGPERAAPVRGNALLPASWTAAEAPLGKPPPAEQRAAAGLEGLDLVFLDPPFAVYDDPAARAKLLAAVEALIAGPLRPGAALVVHAPARALETVRLRGAPRTDLRRYGTSSCLYVFPAVRAASDGAPAVAESP